MMFGEDTINCLMLRIKNLKVNKLAKVPFRIP